MDIALGSTIDRYTVEIPLGEGGMAVVYRVRHNSLGSLHALKVLTISAPSVRERLLQEGRVQASLRHPNVVSVTDVIDVHGAPGLIMEFVEGPSLEGLLSRHRPTIEQAESLAIGIISGVASAHRIGLIHRDLKPANVLIAFTDVGLVPKVADFGLAKLLSGEGDGGMRRTRSGQAMGTPSYMAPEQIRDAKNVDKRADIFSLGAILYELVCGAQAFPGDDILTVFNAIASGSYRPPREHAPDLPDRIVAAIEGALHTRPDDRIADCDALLARWTGERWQSVESGLRSQPVWDAQVIRGLSASDQAVRLVPPAQPVSNQTFDGASLLPGEGDQGSSSTMAPSTTTPGMAGGPSLAPGDRVGPAAQRRVMPGPWALLAAVLGLVILAGGGWAVLGPSTAPVETQASAAPTAPTAPEPSPAGPSASSPPVPPGPAGSAEEPVFAPAQTIATVSPAPAAVAPASPAAPASKAKTPVAGAPAVATAAPVAQAPAPPAADAPPASGGAVELTIKSYPLGAKVKMDGNEIGTSPCSAKANPGLHIVEFTLPDGRQSSKVIQVTAEGPNVFGQRF